MTRVRICWRRWYYHQIHRHDRGSTTLTVKSPGALKVITLILGSAAGGGAWSAGEAEEEDEVESFHAGSDDGR